MFRLDLPQRIWHSVGCLMKSLTGKRKCLWSGLLLMAAGGFLALVHPSKNKVAETIEIRDYELYIPPNKVATFSDGIAIAKWKLSHPGRPRFLDVAKTRSSAENPHLAGVQSDLTRLGYDFPNGCFATDVWPSSSGTGIWRIAHYPSVLDKIQADFDLKMVASSPRFDLVDPGPRFQKCFERADRIEFQFAGLDYLAHQPKKRLAFGRNVSLRVIVDDPDDVRKFFDLFKFVPYQKASSISWSCDGSEVVSVYRGDDQIGTFSLIDGNYMRWPGEGTDIDLTMNSVAELEQYLDKYVYGSKYPFRVDENKTKLLSGNFDSARTVTDSSWPKNNNANIELKQSIKSGAKGR